MEDKRGFTLIELLIAAAIMGVIGLTMWQVYLNTIYFTRTGFSKMDLSSEAALAMEHIKYYLTQAMDVHRAAPTDIYGAIESFRVDRSTTPNIVEPDGGRSTNAYLFRYYQSTTTLLFESSTNPADNQVLTDKVINFNVDVTTHNLILVTLELTENQGVDQTRVKMMTNVVAQCKGNQTHWEE